ncbi:MAG: (2Fe-2S)-binding protein [Deltaproteobacteria bacterium]|nr:(2Fe-2S)-binding protein [Deltaproteobacteria bacterium]
MLPAVTRFFHPVLPSRELSKGEAVVTLAGRRYGLSRGRSEVGARALGDAPPARVCERYGYLWLGDEALPASAEPAIDDEGFEHVGCFGARFEAPLHVAFDNFSEDEHTPWVHHFLGWREADLSRLDFRSENHPDRTEVRYSAPQRPSVWTPALLLLPGDHFHNQWVTRFDPVRTVYTLHWFDPKTRRPRPVVSRFAIYFVPETAGRTWLHTFAMARLEPASLRFLMPVVRRVVPFLGRNEVGDDARWIPNVAGTPFSFEGMRLGRFDAPLVHNHHLLETLYWQASMG